MLGIIFYRRMPNESFGMILSEKFNSRLEVIKKINKL